MSIEKMSFVNIVGDLSFLNRCILELIKFKMFHIEKIKEDEKYKDFKTLNEQNPYIDSLNMISETFNMLKIPKNFENCDNFKFEIENEEEAFLKFSYEKIKKNQKDIFELKNKIKGLKNSLEIIGHIKNINCNLNEIKKANHMKISFGKIAKENYINLSKLEDQNCFFVSQDLDESFHWGFLVTPNIEKEKTENIFKKIGFLEHVLPDELQKNPDDSKKAIMLQIKTLEEKINKIYIDQEDFKEKNLENLNIVYRKFKILSEIFNYRKFAKSNKNQFNICGFVPKSRINYLKTVFKKSDGIVLEFLEQKEIKSYSPPVKLKTCGIFKPFEMYITTYGTPQYGSINPSSFVGFIYSIIFGVMFGDCGQGLVLLVGGIAAWIKNKNKLGLILTRCGFSSVVFGVIYDSIFGFEGKLENFWKHFGFGENLPFHLLKPSNSIPILVMSCIFGMFIILISIAINIVLKLKNKKFGEALFSHNGLAGFVCYASCTAAVLSLIFLKKNIFSPIVVAITVVLPLILIFFSIPLEDAFKGSNKIKEKKEKFTISGAIFDMIDILLSYFTNTLSFLRIGGLALSHAALMLVVMKFAKMAANLNYIGNVGGTIVVVLGNAFVILLEGLIVSIQALRLIYYEIFSRFYQSNGKPFQPIKINFKN